MSETKAQPSPLLRLPFEIRLMIYELLLFPSATPQTGNSTSVTNLLPDYHTYYTSDTDTDAFTLTVRTIDPYLGAQSSRNWRKRSTFHVQIGPFSTSTIPTTYRVLLSPYTAHLRHTVPSLLGLNRQIHAEASKILYSTYTFSFHTNIEAIVPFLQDLTPVARARVQSVGVTKKALPYTKEFDRAEWASAFSYLSSPENNICLATLKLDVMAGKPATGWEDVKEIEKSDFEVLRRVAREWASDGGMDLEWAEQMMAVKGLRNLSIKAQVEHCPPPRSETMAFFIAFSKSINAGFEEFVRGEMVVKG